MERDCWVGRGSDSLFSVLWSVTRISGCLTRPKLLSIVWSACACVDRRKCVLNEMEACWALTALELMTYWNVFCRISQFSGYGREGDSLFLHPIDLLFVFCLPIPVRI